MERPWLEPIVSPWARPFSLPGGRVGVLLLHGFTGTPGHMRRLGEALHADGCTVECPLLPGHGTSLADMEKSSWRLWLRAARDACHRLLDRCERVYVGGLSMGGTLTLLLAEEMPLAGAFPMAAPMRIYDRLAPWTPLLGLFVRYRPHGPKSGEPHLYDVGYRATPVRKVPDLTQLMRQSEAHLDRITCPMLVVQPCRDETVVPQSANIILQGAVHSPSRILWLHQSPHVCTLEPEFETLLRAVRAFLADPYATDYEGKDR